MEEGKGGEVKHILLAKFREDLSAHQIDELINGYAKLVSLIEPMKALRWFGSRRNGTSPKKHCCSHSLRFRNSGGIPIKTGCWNGGEDVSIENMHQGFTHVFESTFESTEGIAEYIAHPAHVEFANIFLSKCEKVLIIDYKPSTLQ